MELKLIDGTELTLPSNRKAAARYLANVIRNNGHLPDSDTQISWAAFAETISPKNKDLVRTSEITPSFRSLWKFLSVSLLSLTWLSHLSLVA